MLGSTAPAVDRDAFIRMVGETMPIDPRFRWSLVTFDHGLAVPGRAPSVGRTRRARRPEAAPCHRCAQAFGPSYRSCEDRPVHTSVRPAAFAILASLVACGEPDPSQPAPIGMSGGSVTAGGQGGTTVTTAGTDGPPGMTTLPGSDSSDGSTGGTGGSTGGPDSMPDSTPDSMPDSSPDSSPTSETTAGAGTCIEGDVCEGDGVCVLFVDGAGIELVCSHGESGEPCALDAHCLSGQCVSEVSMGGVVSTCA